MLKLGYNEATCKENSSVERDLALCEKYGYEYIELRLDMWKDYFKTHTIEQECDPRNVENSLTNVKASVDFLEGIGYNI